MSIFKRFTLVLLAFALCSTAAWGAIADEYSFSSSTATAYSEITGGETLLDGEDSDDGTYDGVPIGFTFTFYGAGYTSVSVSDNGYIMMGDDVYSTFSGPIGNYSTSMHDVISALGDDLRWYSSDNPDLELRYQTLGAAPYRVFVLQWKDVSEYSYSTSIFNFQIRLYESYNRIEIHYGDFTVDNDEGFEVGLRGVDDTDFFNRVVTDGTNNWTSSTQGTNNDDECEITTGGLEPPSGLVYTFEPANDMDFVGDFTYQIEEAVSSGTESAPIIALEIETENYGNALAFNEIVMNTNGSSDIDDIENIRIYSTPTGVFSTDNQIGMVSNPTTGDITISTDGILAAGYNYIWITYDVAIDAPAGNVVDAEIVSFTLGTTEYTPTISSPDGSRTIQLPLEGLYTVGVGGDYESLRSAVADLMALGASGDVEFQVISDLEEIASVDILPWTEIGGDWDLTISADANGPHVVSADVEASGVINLVAVDDVIIDGQGNSANRNLTITNTNEVFGIGVLLYSEDGVVGGDNITIMNTNFIGSNNSIDNNNTGIFIFEEHNNVTIDNNTFHTLFYGINTDNYLAPLSSLVITNNEIGSHVEDEYLTGGGMRIEFTEDCLIDNNRIFNVKAPDGINNNVFGIGCYDDHPNMVISNNVISGIYNRDYDGEGAFGIYLDIDDPALVINNFISDILGENENINDFENTAGIQLYSSTSDESKFYHNTIYMTGEQFNGNGDMSDVSMVAAFNVGYTSSDNHDVRNNIFHCEVTGNTGSEIYAMYLDGDENVAQCDYNNYYSSYKIAEVDGVEVNSISDLQAETGDDQNSVNIQTEFVSETDLHLNNGSIFEEGFRAPAIADVETDIDGEERRTSDVYIGADEIYFTLVADEDLVQPELPNCPGDYIELTFVPTVGSFADGVERTFNNDPNVYDYTWYKDGDVIEGNYANSNTVMGNMLVLGDYQTDDAATYYVEAELGGGVVTSSMVDYTIEYPIEITEEPMDNLTCRDQNVAIFSVGAVGTYDGYQWQMQTEEGWIDLEGENESSLRVDLTNLNLMAETDYFFRVMIEGPGNCGPAEIYSREALLWFAEPITEPMTFYEFDPANVCFGDRIELTAEGIGTIYGYQWQKRSGGSWVDISTDDNETANEQTFVIDRATLAHSGAYRALILGSTNCSDPFVPTPQVDITVWPLFSIASQPEGVLVCDGEEVMLDVVADGLVHNYHWYKDGRPMDAEENPTVLTPILDLGSVSYEESGLYTCVMTIEDCRGISEYPSDGAVVYVLRETEITEQPQDAAANIGEDITFTVEAHVEGAPPNYEVLVQWYRGTFEITDDERIEGAKSSILTIKNVQQSDYANDYYARVFGLCGEAQTVNVAIAEGPGLEITEQPMDHEVCMGEDVTFEVEAQPTGTGTALTYQWMLDGVDLVDGGDVAGATTATLVISNVTPAEEGEYTCEVTVTPGNISEVSDPGMLEVNMPPVITAQPEPTVAVDTDKEFTLSVEATGTDPLTYQWYKDGTEITGETSSTFYVAQATTNESGTYTVEVFNQCGSVMSDASVVTVTKSNNTSVEEPVTGGFALISNTPNPFHEATTVKFAAAYSTHVTITLTDVNGRVIGTVYDGDANAGVNEFELNARDMNLSSGTYFMTMRAAGYTMTKQIVLVK
ncbi:MAG: immunoglobulin domain-containing protein [Candidatus Kapaibacterium sp.]